VKPEEKKSLKKSRNKTPHTEDLSSRVPSRYSPSRLSDFIQCPKLFYYKTILGLKTPNTIHTAIGTLAHHGMEMVFDLPSEQRTPQAAKSFLLPFFEENFETDESYQELLENGLKDKILEQASAMVDNWFKIEDPTKFEPDARELHVESSVDGVSLHGFIDRLDTFKTPDEQTVVAISDYKGLCLETPIPTPAGFKPIKDLKVGDTVVDAEHRPTNIVAVSSIHHKKCYKMIVNGTSVVCDQDHLWPVAVSGAEDTVYETLSTQEIFLIKSTGLEIYIPATKDKKATLLEVESVEQTDTVPTVCIAVDSPTNTFLCTKDSIPTHNTGKVPPLPFQDKAFFAMKIYALLVEQSLEKKVDRLRLIYVKNGSKQDVLRQKVTLTTKKQTKNLVKSLDKKIRENAAKGAFPPQQSALCQWCHFQQVCPAWAPELAHIPILDMNHNPAPR